ncbi:TetR/AcrR family transcriptional regulator [Streptomyces sp. NBC_01352]|uniref:TetR/AcrR family transcriptional regulator n=1 Tax=unclassified Streptomyces TaxID=2593676 RepID=UPI00224DC0B4|nr:MULTISPECIES: TetR/AcrR family transcriptional regulator [unclassified Streptomyces]MCX4702685.1 TetR/AcrR family transcriptional regulator [Streptomyces sp. NBC_01373]
MSATKPGGSAPSARDVRIDDWRTFAPLELHPILAAALEEFREHGYHGTSVRDVARRAGVSLPMIYYRFENKQGLLVALLEDAISEVLHRAHLADSAAQGRVLERFANVIECIVLHMTHRAATAGLDSELRYLEPANRKKYAALRKELEELLLGIIEEGVTQGLFEVDRAPDTGRALLGMCQAVAAWFHSEGPLAPEEIADRYVAISLRTVGARVRPVSRSQE